MNKVRISCSKFLLTHILKEHPDFWAVPQVKCCHNLASLVKVLAGVGGAVERGEDRGGGQDAVLAQAQRRLCSAVRAVAPTSAGAGEVAVDA